MSDAASPQSHGFSLGRVLMLAIPLALVVGGVYAIANNNARQEQQQLDEHGQRTTLTGLFGGPIEATALDKAFKDADGDMLADAPADAEQKDPEELNFSYVASSDTDGEEEAWAEVVAALGKSTGKKVNLVSYADTAEQMRALKEGDLQITAFSTGEAPGAVNAAGFIPVACFADQNGDYRITMKIIVPADSNIEKIEDIKGKRMKFVRPRSNTGCTAALVMLMDKHNLLPDRDYKWGFSYGHENSIKGVAEKKWEVAAVASDILSRMMAAGDIPEDSVKVIYESESFPPSVVGYAYDLKPGIQDAIRETLVDFDWKGTGLENRYGASGTVKFAAVNYKDDWKAVRDIRDSGSELLTKLAGD